MDPLQLKFSIVFPNVDALSRCSPCQIDECIETVFCLWRGLTSLCEGHVLDNACTCLNPFFVWHNFPAPVNRAGIHQTFIDSVANSVHLNNWKLDAICKQSLTVHGLHGDSTFGNRWWTNWPGGARSCSTSLQCWLWDARKSIHTQGKCLCWNTVHDEISPVQHLFCLQLYDSKEGALSCSSSKRGPWPFCTTACLLHPLPKKLSKAWLYMHVLPPLGNPRAWCFLTKVHTCGCQKDSWLAIIRLKIVCGR